MSIKKLIQCFFALILIVSFTANSAQASTIPDDLKKWTSWALKDEKTLKCTRVNLADFTHPDNRICAWSGTLTLDVNKSAGQFSTRWEVLESSLVPLPGSNANWPQNVLVNGKPVAVISHQNQPTIELDIGTFSVTGSFKWQSSPEIISVPLRYGNLALNVDSNAIEFPKRQGGQVWLKELNENQAQEDSVTIFVNRRISDGSYLTLETIIELDVSGKLREETLGKALPEGFKLSGIKGELPAFVDANGYLHANLSPGSWEIKLTAYAPPTKLSWDRPEQTDLWPNQETWSFQSNEAFRTGKLTGGRVVDSQIAEIPVQWSHLPTFVLGPTDQLILEVSHRGRPLHLENKMTLKRDLWLSFDGKQLFFNDSINGDMIQNWRLSMPKPYVLQSANDQDGAMLVTTMTSDEHGIENRYPSVDINARGVINASSRLPIVGWDSHFDSVTQRLVLPPGHMLFAVFGADSVSKSWLGNWSIWSSFIVLFSAVFAGRIIHPLAGIITALLLATIFQEHDAPVISIVNLLIAIGIIKYQPFKKVEPIAKAYLLLSILAAAGSLLYFSATQIKTVIYPQLESHDYYHSTERKNTANQTSIRGLTVTSEKSNQLLEEDSVEMISMTGSRLKQVDQFAERYQADAVIQTGTGIPDWQWHQHTIRWNSPVSAEQEMKLVILGQTSYAMMKMLGVGLILLWLLLVLKSKASDITSYWQGLPSKASTIIVATLLCSHTIENTAFANSYPSQAMLEELYQTLTEAPECAPKCAVISNLRVDTQVQEITLSGSISALYPTAIALPKSEFWLPQVITLNGKLNQAMVNFNGWHYLPVKHGITEFSISGKIHPVESLQLQFKTPPKYINVEQNQIWEISGLSKGVLTGDALSLTSITPTQSANENQSSRYKYSNYVTVRRKITLDQNWRIHTIVERISPATGAINMGIPLIPGEFVSSPGADVKGGLINIVILSNQNQTSWTSTLSKTDQLKLSTHTQHNLVEHWEIVSNPSWHFKASGLPVIMGQQDSQDYFSYSFYPQTGESLMIDISRPAAVKGNSIAIDNVFSALEQGDRTASFNLTFNYRSSRGGEHVIELPSGFVLKEVKSDNRVINLQPDGVNLALPISPGSHSIDITLRKDAKAPVLLEYPSMDLNAPSSNLESKVILGRSRWVLWADGPLLGPAVIYWGQLFVFVLLAILLSKIAFSPLKTWQWLLLGFGLSLNNWATLILMATWFASLTAVKFRTETTSKSLFNLSQLLLYLLSATTLIAIVVTIPASLLSHPDMGIEGNNSYNGQLVWFADKSLGALPDISVLSLPSLIYKGIMLLWVMWLSFSLLSWVKWAWNKISQQGYWRD